MLWDEILLTVIVGIIVLLFVLIPLLAALVLFIIKFATGHKEGRRLRTNSPMNRVIAYIMPTRNDALNYITDSVDIDAAEEYIAKKRAEGLKGFGMMHLFLAAYVRTVAEKPGINRFVRGQEVYARTGDDIQIMLAVKKKMALNAQETVIKIHAKPTDTPEDIFRKFDELISANKTEEQSNFDKTAKFFSYLPGLVFKYAIWLIRFLDYFSLLPAALTEVSPFHGSCFITSMGSLGIPPIYHHIYNFGNVPVFLAIGAKNKELYLDRDGAVKERRKMDFTVVTDERICDGFYYASALKSIRNYVLHPEKMDEPVTVVPDID